MTHSPHGIWELVGGPYDGWALNAHDHTIYTQWTGEPSMLGSSMSDPRTAPWGLHPITEELVDVEGPIGLACYIWSEADGRWHHLAG